MEGIVGGDVDMSMAKDAARRCATAILAEAQSHLGRLIASSDVCGSEAW
jgi:hypothetical protein